MLRISICTVTLDYLKRWNQRINPLPLFALNPLRSLTCAVVTCFVTSHQLLISPCLVRACFAVHLLESEYQRVQILEDYVFWINYFTCMLRFLTWAVSIVLSLLLCCACCDWGRCGAAMSNHLDGFGAAQVERNVRKFEACSHFWVNYDTHGMCDLYPWRQLHSVFRLGRPNLGRLRSQPSQEGKDPREEASESSWAICVSFIWRLCEYVPGLGGGG